MDENFLQLTASFRIVWLAIFTALYGFGGISGKWKRRIIGAIWVTIGLAMFSSLEGNFSWWYLGYAPLFYGAMTLPYGADKIMMKVKKRAAYGCAAGVAALPVAIGSGQWEMFGLHIVLATIISVFFGVLNPVIARKEETIIATYLGVIPLFMV